MENQGDLQIKDLGYNFFLVHGLGEEDRVWILAAKPWRLGDFPVLERTWKLKFVAREEASSRVTAIWVTIRDLPNEYHTPDTLIRLRNLLGKIIALDARNIYQIFQVRICVELNIDFNLPNHILVDNKSFKINFENLFLFEPLYSSSPVFRQKIFRSIVRQQICQKFKKIQIQCCLISLYL